jgi:protein-tyrosine phosphatase
MTAGFPVLLVCSGNICRSRMAELVFRARGPGDAVDFSSAGTIANPGVPMTEEALATARSLGGQPDGRLSRRLSRDLVAGAGLVLTASREHRAGAVELYPRASAYTFTLRQFARLLESAAVEDTTDGAGLVAQVAARRGYTPPVAGEADDVPDPYRRPFAVYEAAGGLIGDAVATIAPALARLR